ncbi:MAG: pyridoxine 5'-phosphate synthase [Gammaproteobacteria bacterium]|nr:pyridoxine 5'-phosphate synthase [Gammaproteobacteria bacterium]MDD9814839.1 pyridoxine 5'-phosphate synthase [Gammaproteobacteria bacterium]MDD9871402.1 pyridoxine 5'-phosphate synthase [Gammaproteobacteria bacterium]
MTALSVNLNKAALLRNARAGNIPDLADLCRLCLEAGADGITVHPRPDQRHIRADDVAPLSAVVAGHGGGREFNMEGNPLSPPRAGWPGFLQLAEAARPAQCTLVPDDDGQATSDHGWDLARDGARLRPLIAGLRAAGARVSLFVDADPGAAERAFDAGAERVEIYTGPYAAACARGEGVDAALELIRQTAQCAARHGLGVNAGHDLNLDNLPRLARAVPQLAEVSIGHALTADALRLGLGEAIKQYKAALAAGGGQ